jgi:hypothetical protein
VKYFLGKAGFHKMVYTENILNGNKMEIIFEQNFNPYNRRKEAKSSFFLAGRSFKIQILALIAAWI